MKILIPVIAVLALAVSGCASEWKIVAVDKAAAASDQILIDAQWTTCKGASVGSVKRKFGQTVERAQAYKDYCDGAGEANVVAPNG